MPTTKRHQGQRAMTPTQWAERLAAFDSLKIPLSLTEQAERLGVTPPAVSYQRRKLEREEQLEIFAAA